MTTGTKRRPYRRDEILAAAVKLFHERGYHATGMDDIGAEAGISGPAIYRHFKGKEEILEVLLLEAAQTGLEAAHEVVSAAPSPRQALERLARHYVDSHRRQPGPRVRGRVRAPHVERRDAGEDGPARAVCTSRSGCTRCCSYGRSCTTARPAS